MDILGNIIAIIVITTGITCHDTPIRNIKITPSTADMIENSTVIFNCTFIGNGNRLKWTINKTLDINICLFGIGSCKKIYSKDEHGKNCECTNTTINETTVTLQISNLTSLDHNTSLKCVASVDSGTYPRFAKIYIQVPVKTVDISPPKEVIQISENTKYEFQCTTSYSRPVPNVTWKVKERIDDQDYLHFTGNQFNTTNKSGLTSAKSTFNYSPNKTVNGWRVYCEATNNITLIQVRSAAVKLDITYPPESDLKINDFTHESDYKVIEHDNGKLICEINGGNPQPLLTWDCYTLGHNMNMTDPTSAKQVIWQAKRKTDRKCTCSSEQKEKNDSLNVNVEILYPPDVPYLTTDSLNVSEVASVILHGALSLNCDSDSKPKSNHTWKLNNRTMDSRERLEINSITKENQGQYTCVAENMMVSTDEKKQTGTSNVTIGIQVLYPPTIDTIDDQNVIEGSAFSMSCPVHPGNPNKTQFNWTTNGDKRHWLSQTFIIPDVSKSDDMIYTCTVSNMMSPTIGDPVVRTNSEDFHLNVEYNATVLYFFVNESSKESNVTVKERDYVRFICIVDSNPVSTTDLKNESEAVLAIRETNNLSYTFGPVACLDIGVYTCTGKNKLNNGHVSELQLFLSVYCSPRAHPLIPFKANITTAQNVRVVVNFSALAYPKPTSIFWQKYNGFNWTNLTSDNNFTIQRSALNLSLTIHKVMEAHFGQYKLVIVNAIDSHEQIFHINAEDKPDQPSEFRALDELVTQSSITLQWNPAFDGGKPQNFVISYSESNYDWSSEVIADNGETLMNFTIEGLSPGTIYWLMIHAENSIGQSAKSGVLHIKTKVLPPEVNDSNIIGVVTGCVLGVIILLGISFGLLFYRKRHGKETDKLIYENVPVSGKSTKLRNKPRASILQETPFEGLQDVDDVPQVQNEHTEYYNSLDKIEKIDRIKVLELFQYVLGKDEDDFAIEYQKIPTELQKPCTFARKPENIALNRYNGIFPYDHSRVQVHGQPNFFINACYIDGYERTNAYIASLGPTAKTTSGFETFWQMVWHERSDVIVMLTNLTEPSGMKCEQYWPVAEASLYYGDICVSSLKTEVFAEYTVRTFAIVNDEEKRYLTHLHYTAWPDKTIPEDVTSLIEFRQRMKSTPTTSRGPIIVHCSAGIGRTGTLIALDRLIEEGQDKGSVNVFECVNNMREQRVKMVQTLEQYIYIYKALVNALTFDNEVIPIGAFNEYMETTNNNMYSRMFQELRQSVETDKKEDSEARNKNESYANKNRHGADIPGNRFRVFLFISRRNEESDYINAIYLNSFKKKDFFIVAQTPLPSTVEDFIGMVYQEDCSCIVTMDDLKEPATRVGKYLPDDKKMLTFGSFKVSCSILETNHQYVSRRLKIKNEGKIDSGEKSVFHFQYTKWMTGNETPANATEFVQFVNDVEEYGKELCGDRSHVLVHCMNANERSGLFCAVSVLLEKLKLEHQASVSNTLRHCRTRRRSAITSMEQLRFCYQAASVYAKMIRA